MSRGNVVDGRNERLCCEYLKGSDLSIGPVGQLKIPRCAMETEWVGTCMRMGEKVVRE